MESLYYADVELFLLGNEVDDDAANALRACDPEVQKVVIGRGDLTGARNPSAALLARIREAGNAGGSSGAWGSNGSAPGGWGGQTDAQVEGFIASNSLDDKAADALRTCEPHVQQVVMARGDLSSARNPSAALLARIRDAQNRKGSGGNPSSAPVSRAFYGGCGPANMFAGRGWLAKGGCWGPAGCGPATMFAGRGWPAKGLPRSNIAMRQEMPSWCRRGPLLPGGGCKGCLGATEGPYNPEEPAQQDSAGDEPLGPGGGAAPAITWVTLPGDSALVQEGLSADGPAISHDKTFQATFSNAHHILSELVGDMSEVTFNHDPEWDKYPDVAEALKAAGGEQNCQCIVICPSKGKWAVGLGGGWKTRETAGKLAMAVALAVGTEQLGRLMMNYPEFADLCSSAGLADAPEPEQKRRKTGGGGKGCLGDPEELEQEDGLGGAPPGQRGGTAPAITWAMLTGDSPLVQEGLSADGPAISHDKTFQATFSNAHNILSELVSDMSEVAFNHDAEWKEYPDVAEALRAAGAERNCHCLVTCPSQGKWAVGIGSGWKARETAGKLALAVALAVGTERLGQLMMTYPEFGDLCSSAGLGDAAGLAQTKQTIGGAVVPAITAGPAGGAMAPAITWAMLTGDSPLVQEGLSADGPAISHDKTFQATFSNAHNILSELVTDMSEVAFNHDTEWKAHPDVAEALRAAGAERNCYCVVTCPSQGKWAVGIGSGWKARETAGKLAMAVALAVGTERLGELMMTYPEFGDLCSSAGLGDAPGLAQTRQTIGGW
eukprot:CAMPEP_0179014226 /NCGR_PEP_ID=MMETSP0796-20121207/2140_1 /TAXON_ID=73915 /ORGANISM="Pyrodinium bahamense, Strain pbaha01" /LENGTH=776 /DNA_ID=CAMNT_0020709769 /DNA_START=72 /DNA_END=2402 /DNA_ORIENTATION=+